MIGLTGLFLFLAEVMKFVFLVVRPIHFGNELVSAVNDEYF